MPFRKLFIVKDASSDPGDDTPGADDAYVLGVQRGDEVIFAALVRAYIEPLTQFAFGYTGDEDAAHDIVQDVFTRVWLLGRDWSPTKGVAPYLFGAIRNRAQNAIRAKHARGRMQERARAAQAGEIDDHDPYTDPMLIAIVRREFQQLTDRQQDVLRLRYEQGHTLAQTAALLNVDVSAVKKLIVRGITALRFRLAEVQKNAE